ncbi:MAG TPA: hypothetical protein PK095_11430 [Myxococcota bacterium]|nr:hypothetical protein [Myxococcota bacterium]
MRWLVVCVLGVVLGSTARAERTTETRPWSVSMDTGFGAPTGLFGATVGWMVTPELELALGGGLGFTGIQASLAARYLVPVGDSPTMSWVFGLGPSLAFRSESLGFHIERKTEDTVIDEDKLYHTAWLNAELGWVARADWGGVLAISLGAGLRLADNQRTLCEDAPDEGGDCNPPHFGPGSIYARAVVLPSFGMRFGWAF